MKLTNILESLRLDKLGRRSTCKLLRQLENKANILVVYDN